MVNALVPFKKKTYYWFQKYCNNDIQTSNFLKMMMKKPCQKASTLNPKKKPSRNEKEEQKVSTYIHKRVQHPTTYKSHKQGSQKWKIKTFQKKTKKTTYALNLPRVAWSKLDNEISDQSLVHISQ